jgi:alcohol dehydrogenase (cytochrome c)
LALLTNRLPFITVTVGTLLLTAIAQRNSAQQQARPPKPVLANYKPVTAERLKNPEDSDWLMFRRTYDGWGYSPLEQITPENVKRLQPVWVFSTATTNRHEAPPIVNNGVMFVATPGNQVLAFEAKTGALLWRYRRPLPADAIILHRTSRGVGLYGDKVFFATNDAFLVALDARTGKEVWVTKVANNKDGYYMTLAPLVADGKVMVGTSGGETGTRGFVAAFDIETGKELWKVYTVPAPGEPGSETWPSGDEWKKGGGPVWVTGNYDPESNLAYWGTGNGGPRLGDQRPGDNLYTSSTIAVDVGTGRLTGFHQYAPNEAWDWDEVSPPILVDYKRNGKTIKGLIDVARDGYIWFLERSKGSINFVAGEPFVKQNVFTSIDPVTGRPTVDLNRKPNSSRSASFCPSFWGGKNWPPIAFSPKTRMIYIPANENLCGSPISVAPEADHIGEVQAWDVDTGKRVWTHQYSSENWGPMLATAGGLVFSGGTNDRLFHAFDAKDGKLLWEFPTNSGIMGTPSTFMVDGVQYVAVVSGWGKYGFSTEPDIPEGGAIWVFAVK